MPLGHGIGGVRDLPVPESFFFPAAAVVLVLSFVLLGALWRRPQLERRAAGRTLPGHPDGAAWLRYGRIALQAVSAGLLVVTLWSAFSGTTVALENFAPTFVYVIFWLGVPLLSVVFGDVWRVLSPWRALADGAVWALERGGREARPLWEYPERFGRYPAALGLLAFVALELAHPRPADPRVLAVAAALYTYWALAGMAVYGRDAWTRGGEGFAVTFGLLAHLSAFARREQRPAVRWPLTGLGGTERVPGTLAVVSVLLGSTAFDGFSRTSSWQDLLAELRAALVDGPVWRLELATTAVNLAGLIGFAMGVALAYLLAVGLARRLIRHERSLGSEFVLSLLPIAFAYMVAHYFSLFLIQGQFVVPLASDPLGRGWNLFGTAGYVPDLAVVSPETVWYVQVGALVLGHVAGLAVAHDRAVAIFPSRAQALRSQYPMLALMVLFTVGGLWLLSQE